MRLSGQLGVLGAASVLVAVAATHLVTVEMERSRALQGAEAQVDRYLRGVDEAQQPLEVWRGAPDEGPRPSWLRVIHPGQYRLTEGERQLRVVVRETGPSERLALAFDDADYQSRLHELRRSHGSVAIWLASAALICGTWWAGWLLRRQVALRRRLASPPRLQTGRALAPRDATAAALTQTYTEYVSLLYDPDERSKEFIAQVAHELRTPITLVRTGCEVLATIPDLSERHRQRLARMMSALDHMAESVGSFMILARDGHLGPPDTVSLLEVCGDLRALHAGEARDRGIDIRVEVPVEAAVQAHRDALLTVIGNLLRNAIRHAAGAGQVVLSYSNGTLRVADQGPGISLDERARIFQPFYRARRAAEGDSHGLGLGLAIVKRICDFYEWRIEVTDRPGGGTEFRIHFGD